MLEDRSILLGVTGSIAAYKAVELARLFVKARARVQVIMTDRARAFVTPLTFRSITRRPVVEQWDDPSGLEIGHVEHGYGADAVVVAPATANTIARLALGLADDALTATMLSFTGPALIAPAMESRMWAHPTTRHNVRLLRERGAAFVGPTSGELASGREGAGRMVEPDVIFDAVQALFEPGDLHGSRLLVTAGPTWEPLDPVRVLTSRATGTFGVHLAEAAARRGAHVQLVAGPGVAPPSRHPTLELIPVESARDMDAAVQARLDDLDALIATAAVSDFRPADARERKLKRRDPGAQRLELVENPDVLTRAADALRARGGRTVVVGFAAETEDLEENAREKRERKGCDFIVANRVGCDRGFGDAESALVWIGVGVREAFGPGSKAAAAEFLLDRVARAVRERSGAHG
jgi:phosphopantothenoylcysteine decarboxylase/phosphopantothenate--cysteine ligase